MSSSAPRRCPASQRLETLPSESAARDDQASRSQCSARGRVEMRCVASHTTPRVLLTMRQLHSVATAANESGQDRATDHSRPLFRALPWLQAVQKCAQSAQALEQRCMSLIRHPASTRSKSALRTRGRADQAPQTVAKLARALRRPTSTRFRPRVCCAQRRTRQLPVRGRPRIDPPDDARRTARPIGDSTAAFGTMAGQPQVFKACYSSVPVYEYPYVCSRED